MSLRRFICMCLLVTVMLISNDLRSQIVIREGNTNPDARIGGDWFLDTLAHQAYYKFNGKWLARYNRDVTGVKDCNGVVLLETKQDTVMYTRTGHLLHHVTGYECLENISLFHYMSLHYFYFDSTYIGMNWGDITNRQVMVKGISAYCATAAQPTSGWSLFDVHAWGVLDLNGNWLIAPIYDGPFQFKNGVAEVMYYGEKRRINEQGEVVK